MEVLQKWENIYFLSVKFSYKEAGAVCWKMKEYMLERKAISDEDNLVQAALS
jgi:hypothetical protein